jgi:hypothetical protein
MNRSNKHSHRQRWIRLFYSILVNRFPALHAPPMPTRLHAPGIWPFFLLCISFPTAHWTFSFVSSNLWCSIISRCTSSYRVIATLVRSSSFRPSTYPAFSSSRHSWHIIYTTAISINQSYNTLLKMFYIPHRPHHKDAGNVDHIFKSIA